MKKGKFLTVLVTSALLAGGISFLSACGGGEGGGTPAVVTEFKVTYNTSDDFEVTGLKESYKEGETVTFKINLKSNLKRISSVKVGKTNLKANDDGEYSFTMGAEDAAIKITVVDKEAPTFVLKFEGKLEAGQTITASTTVDGKAFSDFTLSATSGANLVEINGKSIKLLAAGKAKIKATATYDVFNLEKEEEITIAASEQTLGSNLAYDDHDPKMGVESDANSHRGKWIYNACEGGEISSVTFSSGEYTMNYTPGGLFQSIQLFYSLPYSLAGETYDVRWQLIADMEGDITVNGQVVSLVVGENDLSFTATASDNSANSLVSLQLGVYDLSVFPGSVLKWKEIRIYDLDDTHVYHQVKFTAGNSILKDIMVRDGQKVSAPKAPAQSGKYVEGFFDGELKHRNSSTITAPHNFDAKYNDATPENMRTVTINYGGHVLDTKSVGLNANVELDEIDLGFGTKNGGVFTDEALTQPFDVETDITADTTLYVKGIISFESVWTQTGITLGKDAIYNNADGSVSCHFNGPGATNWHIQLNFTDSLIIGESGKTYVVTFVYSIDQNGGTYQIYDNTSITSGSLDVGEKIQKEMEYAGGTLKNNKKLTFELGAISGDCTFTIHSIFLSVK